MARKKKQAAPVDPEERARLKKMRALQRREARKLNRASRASEAPTERMSTGPLYSDPTYQKDDYEWLRRGQAKAFASKIMNDTRERPYWLVIDRRTYEDAGIRTDPVAHFYPCSYTVRGNKAFYGFLFREHRDIVWEKWSEVHRARKVTREQVMQAVRRR